MVLGVAIYRIKFKISKINNYSKRKPQKHRLLQRKRKLPWTLKMKRKLFQQSVSVKIIQVLESTITALI